MFQSRKCWKANHQVAVIVIYHHTTDKAMMERKDKIRRQELLVAEYETDGSMKFITGEDELWYRDKIKGTVRPREMEFDEVLLKKHFYKTFVQGEIFDELEVE